MKKLLLSFLMLLQSALLFAVNYTGQQQAFRQPDGSSVTLRLYGSEYYMRGESLDGLTVIRDKATGWICYAKLSADGKKLISTGIHFTGNAAEATALNLPQHLDLPLATKQQIISGNQKKLGGFIGHDETRHQRNAQTAGKTAETPVFELSGNVTGLCIVVDFADEPGTLPMSEFEDFCNKLDYTGFGNNGSLRSYYSDISGGVLNYENQVFGYFRAPLTFAEYDAMPYAEGAMQILHLALEWLKSTGFDFNTLTIDEDGHIMAINLMYTGEPPAWAEGMWHHQGYYDGFYTEDSTIRSGRYNTSPAYAPLQMGTICHENGHMIGRWPDTYKYTETAGPDGIGAFDLMCGVSTDWNNPVAPNPLFLSNVGWMKNINVTSFNGIKQDTTNSLSCYKYVNVNDTDEFFLIKGRRFAGRSAGLPDDGLTIWHIDRNGDNQTTHHEVFLEHATGSLSGDHSGACFKPSTKKEFGRTTTPAATFYNGDFNALRVWDISAAGVYMNYKFGAGAAGPAIKLMHGLITGDDNGNGYAETGETANITVHTGNFGTLAAVPVNIATVPADGSSAFVTVNTPGITLASVAPATTTEVPVNITVNPTTPIGTIVTLRHTATNDTSTAIITQSFMVGELITLDETPATACHALFFDPGGMDANYEENTDIMQTITADPGASALTVTFSEFNIEDNEGACDWDYLEVYDGSNTAAPLINRFCGETPPDVIVSSNPEAALTFVFHSDNVYTESGWKAVFSCDAPVSITNKTKAGKINLFPNPTSGLVNISLRERAVISVTDIVGKSTGISRTAEAGNTILDLSSLPDGIYIVRMQGASGISTGKVTLNKN